MKIVIFYDYFHPAFRAGGPVQSLKNLVESLDSPHDFLVITSDSDLGGVKMKVERNQIVRWGKNVQVIYTTKDFRTRKKLAETIRTFNPDRIYLNGMFSIDFVIKPLIIAANLKIPIVLAPRGMLQEGALRIKRVKKAIYLKIFSFLFKSSRIKWHATDSQEVKDIRRIIGEESRTEVASNIPSVNLLHNEITYPPTLEPPRLCYLSLITAKKGLMELVNYLNKRPEKFELGIYGPVKDNSYWEQVVSVIEQDLRMSYHGETEPEHIPVILNQYHYFVLPTFGENFGHAIFEALAMGTPVIISNKTPWNDLYRKKAGWEIDLSDNQSWNRIFDEAFNVSPEYYSGLVRGARQVAQGYVTQSNFQKEYRKLFE